ncbi:MAG: HEAT repeat domain-containing protein, partial [Mastigocoleus sp.]
AAKPYVKDIVALLKDENVDTCVRSGAALALGNLGDAAKPYLKDILAILKDEKVDPCVRSGAAVTLGNLGDAAKPYVKDILAFLKDEKVNYSVRSGAALGLGNLGDAAKPYVKDILAFLKDEKVDSTVRSRAAEGLRNLGDAVKPYIKDIVAILKDEKVDSTVRSSAAEGLGNLGDVAKPYVKDIVAILKDEKVDSTVRFSAVSSLGKIDKLGLNQVLKILNTIYYPSEPYLDTWRFQTYFLPGGTEEVKTLMKWLGHYDPSKIPTKLNHKEAKKTLELFAKIWQPSQDLTRLRKDLAYRIVQVAKLVSWQPQDIVLLETHYKNLKQAGYNEADSIQSIIINLKGWRYFFSFRNTIIIHFLFWLALIFAYPKSPQVQAIFFWNPWVRRIGGMGYVGFLLTWVPFLRGKLLEPFRSSLLADAQLDNFDEDLYFPESLVKIPASPANKGMRDLHQPIAQAIPAIQGQIILQADSGLGKSMFLRHLAKKSRRNVVFLPARKCKNGVIKAIQDKLHGQAQDENFLKNLIYSGTLDICIDGLNEVTADTRANICKFVESYFKGNIIMATQPLEWIAPTTAKTYELKPLTEAQIEQFMLSRASYITGHALNNSHQYSTNQKPNNQNSNNQTFTRKYEAACKRFLKTTLNKKQPHEELAASFRIISNPMDLSLISQMISQGEQPDIFNLQEQQYKLMSKEYKREWGHDFPLKKFSQAVYQMRLNDEGALPGEEFAQELESMEDEKYKMVISRYISTEEEKKHEKEYYFRHDKIMDFFLVQNFLGESEEVQNRLVEHMDDPRFRGVYFLLANFLPLDAAKNLREELINYAADTKDHTVSDKFVQLLRTR